MNILRGLLGGAKITSISFNDGHQGCLSMKLDGVHMNIGVKVWDHCRLGFQETKDHNSVGQIMIKWLLLNMHAVYFFLLAEDNCWCFAECFYTCKN